MSRLRSRRSAISASSPPAGTLIFDGGFDTGTLGEWSNWQGPNGSITVVGATGGVTPRNGAYMARFDVRSGDNAAWGYANVDLLYTSKFVPPDRDHYDLINDDRYYGFSTYMPSATYNPYPGLFNYVAELHGDTGGQAPVKLNLDPTATPDQWRIELHTLDVISGWNPDINRIIAPVDLNVWTDWVIHVLWKDDATGRLEVWKNGMRVVDETRRTWGTGMNYIKRNFGMYRDEHAAPWVFYGDAYKVGTSYAEVAPAAAPSYLTLNSISDLTGVQNANGFSEISTPLGSGFKAIASLSTPKPNSTTEKTCFGQYMHSPVNDAVGKAERWSFSIYLPSQTLIQQWSCGLLWQFHTNNPANQWPSSGHHLSVNSDATFRIGRQSAAGTNYDYPVGGGSGGPVVTFDRWIPIVLEINWQTGSSGYMRIWIDGVQHLNYSGATCFADEYPYAQFGWMAVLQLTNEVRFTPITMTRL